MARHPASIPFAGLLDLSYTARAIDSYDEALAMLRTSGGKGAPFEAAFTAVIRARLDVGRSFALDMAGVLDPEVARVGLNEREAAEQGIAVEVTRYDLDDLDRAITESETRGFVKILTPAGGKDTVLGATIVGAHAGELLAEYVLAMKHGIGLNKILGTIHSYPTMAEANKFAAGNWKKAHKPESLLKWVERYHAWRRG